MEYRREIDGLRAVAVLPVILFHAGFSWFGGGFVGVDVFFVISGYLITSIILAEREAGTFTLIGFYDRRIRRILPALFFVMLVCLPFAWLWMSPRQLSEFSNSLIAVSTFVSNLLFIREADYFATNTELKPLLHTWSLAVEEQFYVLYPLFVVSVLSLGKRFLVLTLALVSVVSLLIAQVGGNFHFSAPHTNEVLEWWLPFWGFYFTLGRAWELLLGGLVGFLLFAKGGRISFRQSGKEALSLIGVILIAYAVISFDNNTPFPSVYTLIPTVGTALLIVFASPQTVVGRVLAHRWLVGIGLISYSAYLWHQPLFAFARLRSLDAPSVSLLGALALASIALGFLTWRYVERPFRDKRRIDRRTVFVAAATMSVAMIGLGLIGHFNKGFAGRFDPKIIALYEVNKERDIRRPDCRRPVKPESACVYGDETNVRIAMLGDSHAAMLIRELVDASAKRGMGAKDLTRFGCLPVRGLYRVGGTDLCSESNKQAFEYVKDNASIETVVMVARWAMYVEGTAFDNGEGGKSSGVINIYERFGVTNSKSDKAGRIRRLQEAIVAAVNDYLSIGKKVVLIYPIPEVGWDVPNFLAKAAWLKVELSRDLSTSYQRFSERNARVYEALDAVRDRSNLIRIKPEKIFCGTSIPGRCIAQLNGALLYADHNHLSVLGARMVVDEIMKYLD